MCLEKALKASKNWDRKLRTPLVHVGPEKLNW
jgi:hypothetical protein